ncbi:hypothetical protein AMTRI_Chr07g78520 [Amborella trichopoda]
MLVPNICRQRESERVLKLGVTKKLNPNFVTQIPQESENCLGERKRTPRLGNLDRFLESTTPYDLAQYFSKMSSRGWGTCNMDYQPFFTLGYLREVYFKEWSVYGTGVPLVLNAYEPVPVVQYYIPYHSANQLYADTSKGVANMRRVDNPYPMFYILCYSS